MHQAATSDTASEACQNDSYQDVFSERSHLIKKECRNTHTHTHLCKQPDRSDNKHKATNQLRAHSKHDPANHTPNNPDRTKTKRDDYKAKYGILEVNYPCWLFSYQHDDRRRLLVVLLGVGWRTAVAKTSLDQLSVSHLKLDRCILQEWFKHNLTG